jgi:2-C-methyl-D-erythritol 4-phosphate cytidylyltransferase
LTKSLTALSSTYYLKDTIKMKHPELTPKIANAVIAAAGSGTRTGFDKLFAPIGEDAVPLLAVTLQAFERCALIRNIIVVTRSERIADVDEIRKMYGITKITHIITGGDTRAESVQAGLHELAADTDIAVIHDGARPLVTSKLISSVVLDAVTHGAAIAAVPVTDTVKHVMNGSVRRTVPRKTLYCAQTPQAFEPGLLKAALHSALEKGLDLTDDAEAAEVLGFPVKITEGERTNIKVTYPEDLIFAEAFLERLAYER